MMVYDKLLVQLANMADYDVQTNEARMTDVLAPNLAAVQDSDLLRGDLTCLEILTACRMLGSHWKLDGQSDFGTAFKKRLSLLCCGLVASGSAQSGELR